MKYFIVFLVCWLEIQWGYQNIEGYDDAEVQLVWTWKF